VCFNVFYLQLQDSLENGSEKQGLHRIYRISYMELSDDKIIAVQPLINNLLVICLYCDISQNQKLKIHVFINLPSHIISGPPNAILTNCCLGENLLVIIFFFENGNRDQPNGQTSQ
jgi:hypothetical protein